MLFYYIIILFMKYVSKYDFYDDEVEDISVYKSGSNTSTSEAEIQIQIQTALQWVKVK